jgi:probable addiction module antidote protein
MKSVGIKTSDYLKTKQDVVAYLNATLEDGGPAVLLEVLRNVAQTGGAWRRYQSRRVSREGLYRTLSCRGNPKIETVLDLIRALGLKFIVESRRAA